MILIPILRSFPFLGAPALTLLLFFLTTGFSKAQNPLFPAAEATKKEQTASTASTAGSDDKLPELKEVKEHRTLLQNVLKTLQKEPELYKEQIRLLIDLDAALARQEEALTVAESLEKEKNALSKVSQLPLEAQINEKFTKPYDLGKLDVLYEVQENLEEETRLALDASVQSDDLLARDLDAYKKSEESRRLAKDLAEELTVSTSAAKLQSRVNLAKLVRSQINSGNTKLKKEILDLRKQLLRPQIRFIQENLKLDDYAWRETKRQYDTQELAIKESLKEAQKKLGLAQKDLEKNTTDSPLATPAEKARMEAAQTGLMAAQRRNSLNETWQEQIVLTRKIMHDRYELYKDRAKPADKKGWIKAMEEARERLEPQFDYLTTSMESARKKLEALRSRARESTDKDVLMWTETSIRHQADLITSFQEEIWSTKAIIQLSGRLLDELDAGSSKFSWRALQENSWNFLKAFWYKELFLLEDRAFRISTLFWVLFWLSIGLTVAWTVSNLLGRKILLHYGIASGAASAYQKLVYYTIIVAFCMGIFEYFNFSLTSLTIISGALALGVGFGSQDIIKNFISGLILLFERPINEGDTIQIEGDVVKVEHIGARSTRVKALDNTQRIVPNSYLLENVIVNWTLSDSIIRTSIEIGVGYGSPTREVSDILLKTIQSIDGVLAEPAPAVLFADFGDNALLFKILFSTSSEERVDATSEARHRISEALEKAKISIPFPQRDIHLDSSRPLEFRILPRIKTSSEAPATPP